jgi:hypothetical protein
MLPSRGSLQVPREISKRTEKLLAELYYDLKGRKTKRLDWMTIAEKCSEVVEDFGSVNDATKKLRVSPSLLNSILRLKKLDPRVQELVRKRLVLFDSAQRLNPIQPNDRQYDVAKMLVGISNKKQRDIIQHALRFPHTDLLDYRKRVTGEQVKRENLRVLIIPMREELYRSLEGASRETKKPIEGIISEIVSEWLGGRKSSK